MLGRKRLMSVCYVEQPLPEYMRIEVAYFSILSKYALLRMGREAYFWVITDC